MGCSEFPDCSFAKQAERALQLGSDTELKFHKFNPVLIT